MTMRTIVAGLAAGVLAAAAAPPLAAQSFYTRAKRAATNAAAATNAHEQAMQQVSPDPQPAVHARRVADVAVPVAPAERAAKPPARAAASARPGAAHAPAAHPGGNAPAMTVTTDSARTVSEHAGRNEIALVRESFEYHADGRRDPFLSLLKTGELRPMLSDLRLVTVIYDPAGGSVAILRDVSTKEQYRVKVGQTLGRMRVAQIGTKAVTFTLEELGFSRQEVLALNDTTRARSQ